MSLGPAVLSCHAIKSYESFSLLFISADISIVAKPIRKSQKRNSTTVILH